MKTGSGEGEIQEVRPLLYVEWNTARLTTERLLEHQELSFTSRPTYLAMLRQHPQQHSTDVETVLTERGHNRAPLSKRRGDFNSARNKQQRRKL